MNNISYPEGFFKSDDGYREMKWTPVTIDMPRYSMLCLVTTDDSKVESGYYDIDRKAFTTSKPVIAWMKFPSPYSLT